MARKSCMSWEKLAQYLGEFIPQSPHRASWITHSFLCLLISRFGEFYSMFSLFSMKHLWDPATLNVAPTPGGKCKTATSEMLCWCYQRFRYINVKRVGVLPWTNVGFGGEIILRIMITSTDNIQLENTMKKIILVSFHRLPSVTEIPHNN